MNTNRYATLFAFILLLSCSILLNACSTDTKKETDKQNSAITTAVAPKGESKLIQTREVVLGDQVHTIIEPPIHMHWREKRYKIKGEEGLVFEEGFHYSGNKRSVGCLKNGEKHGRWDLWYDSGQPVGTFHYSEGTEDGTVEEYYSDGTLKATFAFDMGKKDGVWSRYHENGNKSKETSYKSGTQIGEFKTWREDGRVFMTGQYKNGMKDGEWTMFAESGEKEYIEIYDDGNLVNKETVQAEK